MELFLRYDQVQFSDEDSNLEHSVGVLLAQLRTHSTDGVRVFKTIDRAFVYFVFSVTERTGRDTSSSNYGARQGPSQAASDFTGYIPLTSSAQIFGDVSPMNAPVVAIARLFIRRGNVDTVAELTERVHMPIIKDSTKPWDVICGWKDEKQDNIQQNAKEYFMLSGWASMEAHDMFRDRVRSTNPEYASVREHYAGMLVSHAVETDAQ